MSEEKIDDGLTGAELHQTMDARIWAKEFISIHGGDEELMFAWFANALMCGWDQARGPVNGSHAQYLIDRKKP